MSLVCVCVTLVALLKLLTQRQLFSFSSPWGSRFVNTNLNDSIINVFPHFYIITLRIPNFNVESPRNAELTSVVAITDPH